MASAAAQEDLKARLATVLQDLAENGNKDPEAIWRIGNLAASLVDKGQVASWTALKNALTAEAYDNLLADFQEHGNALAQKGDKRRAYAIQVLGISVVCRTQRADRQLAQGEALLDRLIESAISIYRASKDAVH